MNRLKTILAVLIVGSIVAAYADCYWLTTPECDNQCPSLVNASDCGAGDTASFVSSSYRSNTTIDPQTGQLGRISTASQSSPCNCVYQYYDGPDLKTKVCQLGSVTEVFPSGSFCP